MEFEPNDTPEFANYLPDFATYLATISSRNDVDYYTFTLAKRSEYTAFLETSFITSVLNVEVFDSNNVSVGKFEHIGAGIEGFKETLPAGTYYIRVSVKDTSIRWDNNPYFIMGWFD
jgi:hypothetical protein